VQVELPPAPAKGTPQLPFPEPLPLKATLLDVTMPMSLPALWLTLFHGSSSLLADFHKQLGDQEISISPWRLKGGCCAILLRAALPCCACACWRKAA